MGVLPPAISLPRPSRAHTDARVFQPVRGSFNDPWIVSGRQNFSIRSIPSLSIIAVRLRHEHCAPHLYRYLYRITNIATPYLPYSH